MRSPEAPSQRDGDGVRDGGPEPAAEPWPTAVVAGFWAVTGLLGAVVVLAGLRAAWNGWVPTADDAFLVMRSRAVFSAHPPLLSTASSGGASSGTTFNHPGPLALYLAAPFVRLLGSGGMVVAVSLVNAAAVGVAALLLRRNARPVLAATTLAATAALVWSMGSGLLVDIWNPHVAMLAFLLAVVSTWAVLRDDRRALLAGVLAVSFAAQTHLSAAAMCVPLVVVLVGRPLLSTVRARRADRREDAAGWLRWLGIALAAGVVSALPPIIEQVRGGSDGNLWRLWTGSAFQDAPVGLGRAVALVAGKLADPPFFFRDSWTAPVYGPGYARGVHLWMALVVVVGAFAWTIASSVRRRDGQVRDLAVLVAVLVGVGTVFASQLPTWLDALRLSNTRWLWPLAALSWAVVLTRPLEWVSERLSARRAPVLGPAAGLVAVAVLSVATVPTWNEVLSGSVPSDQALFRDMWDQAHEDLEDLPAVELRGGTVGQQLFVVPALINALDEAGVEVGVTDPVQLQQAGDEFRATGREPWIVVVQGADQPPPAGDARKVADVAPLSAAERRRVERRIAQLAREIRPEDLRPGDGLSARERTRIYDRTVAAFRDDPVAVLSSGGFAGLLDAGVITVDDRDGAELSRLASEAASVPAAGMTVWLVPRASA